MGVLLVLRMRLATSRPSKTVQHEVEHHEVRIEFTKFRQACNAVISHNGLITLGLQL